MIIPRPLPCDNTAYGNIIINSMNNNKIYIWEFKIMVIKDYAICIGIDSSYIGI